MIKFSKYFFPYMIFLMFIGFSGKILICFLFVILHEAIHYIVARKLGFVGFDIEFLPFGTRLDLKDLDEANQKQDILISVSGPIFNLIVAIIFYILYLKCNIPIYEQVYKTNLALGIFNLIPAFPMDGGRILRSIISLKILYRKANKITVYVSIVVGMMFMYFFIVLFMRNIKNFNIGLIAVFVIASSLKEKERIAYIIMGDILKKKSKFKKRGYIENKNISVYYKQDLLNIISIVDKNKYNIFTVLDDDMNVVDMIYENELIKALKKYGNMSIEEYSKIRERE